METRMNVNVNSEIGKLNGVILHTPGREVENMTPENAERALYSDILNLSIARTEYEQLSKVLDKVTQTFQVKDLLADILSIDKVKRTLVGKICKNEDVLEIRDQLLSQNPADLATSFIEGVLMEKNTLTKYLNKDRFSLQPLHNFFFTRDAAVSIFDSVLISKMANVVREREALIMEAIFDYHSNFNTNTINPVKSRLYNERITTEGGDILVATNDTLVIGMGIRTTSQGIDYILNKYTRNKQIKHIFIQELPHKPESFIHLDMVFTFLDHDKCMIYEPLILKSNRFLTLHIMVDNGEVKCICEEENLLKGLKKINLDLKPLFTGGRKEPALQDREQWHSGANFFALAPGKVIGYGRNIRTIEELNNHGYEVLPANEIIAGKINPEDYQKYVITIEGSELSRGGGGCRCMTMPVNRDDI